MGWRPFTGMGQSIFTLLWCKTEGKSRNAAERAMVSTISFIPDHLQHCIVASRILSRTIAVKVIDKTPITELGYSEVHIMGLHNPVYTLFRTSRLERLEHISLQRA